jgi:hypothetical protein
VRYEPSHQRQDSKSHDSGGNQDTLLTLFLLSEQ